jgi:hypothetical protein
VQLDAKSPIREDPGEELRDGALARRTRNE